MTEPLDPTAASSIAALQEQVAELEEQVRSKTATEDGLRRQLAAADTVAEHRGRGR